MARFNLADKLHRAFVYACMGITVISAVSISLMSYEYVAHVRPVRKMQQAKLEQELLHEGQGISDGEQLST